MNKSENKHSHAHSHSCCSVKPAVEAKSNLVKDPVCGMMIDPATAKAETHNIMGKLFIFVILNAKLNLKRSHQNICHL